MSESAFFCEGIIRWPDWEPARGEFLVPVAVLSRKIAAQFRAALKAAAPAVFADIPAAVGSGSGSPSASTTATVTTPC